MANMVYIVSASAGDYDERRAWIVAVYHDPAAAEARQRKAQRRANRLRRAQHILMRMREAPRNHPKRFPQGDSFDFSGSRYFDDFFDPREASNPYDLQAGNDGPDADYGVEAYEVEQ